MYTEHEAELAEGVGEYLLSCQTYEGGFGGEPGNEAHGGYNFCTLAGLLILGMVRDAVKEWGKEGGRDTNTDRHTGRHIDGN